MANRVSSQSSMTPLVIRLSVSCLETHPAAVTGRSLVTKLSPSVGARVFPVAARIAESEVRLRTPGPGRAAALSAKVIARPGGSRHLKTRTSVPWGAVPASVRNLRRCTKSTIETERTASCPPILHIHQPRHPNGHAYGSPAKSWRGSVTRSRFARHGTRVGSATSCRRITASRTSIRHSPGKPSADYCRVR